MNSAADLLAEMANNPTQANIEDLGEGDLQIIRKFLDNDLYTFSIFICGFKDLIPTLHGDLAKWIGIWGLAEVEGKGWVYYSDLKTSDKITKDYRRIMTQIPREHFKTSLGTLANSLWQASRTDPDGVPGVYRPISIINERQENATDWLKSIRGIIQSSIPYQKIYSDLIPPGVMANDTRTLPRWWRWNDSAIDLAGKRTGEVEASISAHGVDSAITGKHWPKIILDDLISKKHKQSQVEMERTRAFIKDHVNLMRPLEGSMVYTNCTPWTYTDVYVDLCRDYNYKLYRRSALENAQGLPDVAGEPIFPEKISKEVLLKKHRLDPFEFSSQMMCIPMSGKDQSFNQSWMKFGTIETDPNGEPVFAISEDHYAPTRSESSEVRGQQATVPPRRVPLYLMDKALIMDPAPTEENQRRNDPHARTAILVEGIDPWGRRFILESWADRVGYAEAIDKIFELSMKWKAYKIGIEEVNFSNVYRHWITREQRRDGKYPNYNLQAFPLLPAGREKHARILAREPDWREGLYYLNAVGTFPFQVELIEYPNSQTLDLLDCMAYDKEALQRPPSPEEQWSMRRTNRSPAPYSESYTITLEGY